MNALLIAGTDTDVGKTVLTSALAAYWQTYCASQTLGIMKPFQTGVGDREHYLSLFDLDQPLDELNPVYFEAPLALPVAAEREGNRVKPEIAWQAFEVLRQRRDFVLVEALGGLGSPITHTTTVADLAWDWHLPVVLVVPVRLGAIAQAVANVALARQSRLHLKGIVLNCVQPCSEGEVEQWASASLIQSLTDVPVVGLIPHLARDGGFSGGLLRSDRAKLTQIASNLELERLIPVLYESL
ncbi:dethiobiotin synthase [Myxacorys almedinensis]|uniref:ATP-dependent dethiobiotin synthetase BioD n=1 Tax=Myxacorys almedinensis A TaxID=2690445 RepID=A0A8J7Z4Z8_9CYAN|nr:dethiobiotin synthase [Myxacorys almedinensis]NDJ18286.1 ATP-dependent dethiobiotin synthetase BioD [Myxacorys almedinensis A]